MSSKHKLHEFQMNIDLSTFFLLIWPYINPMDCINCLTICKAWRTALLAPKFWRFLLCNPIDDNTLFILENNLFVQRMASILQRIDFEDKMFLLPNPIFEHWPKDIPICPVTRVSIQE